MGVTLKDNSKKWDQAKEVVGGMKGIGVRVGFQGDSGGEEVEGMTLARIAAVHEVGYAPGNIPARPFMRRALDLNRDKIMDMLKKEFKESLQTKRTPKQIFSRIGIFTASKVQEQIRTAKEWADSNADITVEQKGSTSPLIDTGQMIQSVSWALVDKGTVQKEKVVGTGRPNKSKNKQPPKGKGNKSSKK